MPALTIDGKTMGDSIAILHYLELTRPTPPLVPIDTMDLIRMWQISNIITSFIQPLHKVELLERIGELGGDSQEWAREYIHKGLSAIGSIIDDTNAKYCIGNKLSIADI